MRLLTAKGLSGVAVVAFDDGERTALSACLRTPAGQAFEPSTKGGPRLASLVLDGEVVDEVLVVDRHARGIEVHLHGSPAVIDAIRAAFPVSDSPLSVGPADLLLRSALSVEQLDLALEQRDADFRDLLLRIAEMTGEVRRHAHAEACERSRIALAHCEPSRLVLVGAQNAGKSTLFNQLLFRERAVTGSLPGLTRDPVSELTTLAGYPYEVVDTAGEGITGSLVDAQAVTAGRRLRAGAIVLLIIDGNRGPLPEDRALHAAADRVLVVATKADLPSAEWPPDLPCDLRVSAVSGDAGELRQRFGHRLAALRALPGAGPVGGTAALTRAQLGTLQLMAQD